MNHTKPSPNQDVLQAELQTAQVHEIRDAVTWCVTDIIILQVTSNSCMHMPELLTKSQSSKSC